ncbi:hypothetical protein F2P81_005412 [Scophthalmus maximus]|uniref:Uncharacterized protein n=1 Tax=Scophthalmus maximus TaxID=52904 RepID=A0A6A4TDJ2_SCOMX|nr:hypothetical protein F2P81_005412 [Scophthalmus maximus]
MSSRTETTQLDGRPRVTDSTEIQLSRDRETLCLESNYVYRVYCDGHNCVDACLLHTVNNRERFDSTRLSYEAFPCSKNQHKSIPEGTRQPSFHRALVSTGPPDSIRQTQSDSSDTFVWWFNPTFDIAYVTAARSKVDAEQPGLYEKVNKNKNDEEREENQTRKGTRAHGSGARDKDEERERENKQRREEEEEEEEEEQNGSCQPRPTSVKH